MQRYVFEFTGTVTPKPKNKDDIPVPYVDTFYVVAANSTTGLNILQTSNPKVTDFSYTDYVYPCNESW